MAKGGPAPPSFMNEKLHAAKSLLQEAVYQARARQAAGVGLSGHQLDQPAPVGGCGMGQAPEEALELSERGGEILRDVWPSPLGPVAVDRVRSVLQDWVNRQDAIDRKRNHFLRDFRQSHGFDRRAYSDEESQAFENGLDRINSEADDRLSQAAHELLRAGEFPDHGREAVSPN